MGSSQKNKIPDFFTLGKFLIGPKRFKLSTRDEGTKNKEVLKCLSILDDIPGTLNSWEVKSAVSGFADFKECKADSGAELSGRR